MLAATMLGLSACSASNTLDPDNLTTAANTTYPTSTEQSLGATVDEGNATIDSAQPDTNNNATPDIGAAIPGDTGDTTESLDPDVTVYCSAPTTYMQQRTLQLINEARSQARSCGTESFAATTALTWNTQLLQAANLHSADMTEHNFFDHTGSDGSTVSTRVDETGYDWSTVGENIAAGQDSASEAIAGWLSSPGHCRNLMNPDFTEAAVTCAEDAGADYTRYWTNVLAAPR